jgi:metal-responsive CopG/Arc/MetJ family transcriptional regulator
VYTIRSYLLELNKVVNISIELADDLAGQLDTLARQEGISRTALVSQIILKYLMEHPDYRSRAVRPDGVREAASTWSLAAAQSASGRSRGSTAVKINVSIPGHILKLLDDKAKEVKASRSGLLVDYFLRGLQTDAEEKALRQRLEALKSIRNLSAGLGDWDGTAEVLKWRSLH